MEGSILKFIFIFMAVSVGFVQSSQDSFEVPSSMLGVLFQLLTVYGDTVFKKFVCLYFAVYRYLKIWGKGSIG